MLPKNFNAQAEANHIVQDIKTWFDKNGRGKSAVIGISGGKDSTIAAKLLVKALGKQYVFGVLMPNGVQSDLADAKRVVQTLGICSMMVNIKDTTNAMFHAINSAVDPLTGAAVGFHPSNDAYINTPPRIRMTTLYIIAASLYTRGMVINTCNRSEDYIGYSTKYGDAAGDYGPLSGYTVSEILAIGDTLHLPAALVHKTPSDGLCGQSDEDRFGFTYETLDRYILTGECDDPDIRKKIDLMHAANLHKLKPIPYCVPLHAQAA